MGLGLGLELGLGLVLVDLDAAMRERGAAVRAAAGAYLGGSGNALLGAAPRDGGLAQVAWQQHPPHRAHLVRARVRVRVRVRVSGGLGLGFP